MLSSGAILQRFAYSKTRPTMKVATGTEMTHRGFDAVRGSARRRPTGASDVNCGTLGSVSGPVAYS